MKQKVYSRDIKIILLASFCYMASPMLVTPLITGFSQSLGTGGFLMGVIGGLANMCSLCCRPWVGNLSDKISKHKLSTIGSIALIIACIGYVIAENPLMIVLARIVNGVGFACCSVCMTTWMSNLLPRDKIGSGMGLYGTMNALSMALAPFIGVKIYQHFGYRVAFVIAVGFAISTLILVQLVKDKGEPVLVEEPIEAVPDKKLHMFDPNVLPVAFIIMLFAIPYCATQAFLLTYTEFRHITITVSLFFPLYAAALLVLRLSLKSLFDKVSFGIFVFGSAICATASMICLTVMQSNLGMLFAALFMAGGYGIMCSVCQSTALLLAPEEKRGLANSTYYVGLDLGMTLGPFIGGLIYDNLDIRLFYPLLLCSVPLALVVYAFHQWHHRPANNKK